MDVGGPNAFEVEEEFAVMEVGEAHFGGVDGFVGVGGAVGADVDGVEEVKVGAEAFPDEGRAVEGEGFGEIVEAFVVMGALGDFEAHVVEGKAGGVGVELFLDELGEEVEGLVGVAEGEDVGVVLEEGEEPFMAGVVVGGHELVEVEAFDDLHVFEPGEDLDPAGLVGEVDGDPGVIDGEEGGEIGLAGLVEGSAELEAEEAG